MKKFALIGCGEAGTSHVRSLAGTGQLVAVCDVVEGKAAALAKAYVARAYTSVDDLLANESTVDVVVICTPNGNHAEVVIKSLQARKHVICESPLCLTTAAAWQIMETEKFCRRRVFIVPPHKFNTPYNELKTKLGDIETGNASGFQLTCSFPDDGEYFKGWRGKMFPGGGLLYTPFCGAIELLTFCFGAVASAEATDKNATDPAGLDVERAGSVLLRMQSGLSGSLHWTTEKLSTHRYLLNIDGQDKNLQYHFELNGEDLFRYRAEDEIRWLHFYKEVLRALETGEQVLPGIREGLQTVEAIELIYKANPQR